MQSIGHDRSKNDLAAALEREALRVLNASEALAIKYEVQIKAVSAKVVAKIKDAGEYKIRSSVLDRLPEMKAAFPEDVTPQARCPETA